MFTIFDSARNPIPIKKKIGHLEKISFGEYFEIEDEMREYKIRKTKSENTVFIENKYTSMNTVISFCTRVGGCKDQCMTHTDAHSFSN